jgi:hypothetical protein
VNIPPWFLFGCGDYIIPKNGEKVNAICEKNLKKFTWFCVAGTMLFGIFGMPHILLKILLNYGAICVILYSRM